jgi:hypothetical protein
METSIMIHSIFTCLLVVLMGTAVHAQVSDTHEARAGSVQQLSLMPESHQEYLACAVR